MRTKKYFLSILKGFQLPKNYLGPGTATLKFIFKIKKQTEVKKV